MLCVISNVDYTSYIPYESISIEQAAGDPVGKATFQLVDPGAQISLTSLQEVIFFDESAALGGNTLIPAINYLFNNNFNFGNNSWGGEIGTLTGRITFPSSGTFGSGAVATLSFSNQAIGSDSVYQNNIGPTAAPFITPGQQYCFSATVNVTSPFTNSYAFIQLVFLDALGNTLSTITSSNITSTSGAQRFSVSGTAPANAHNARALFGGATTSTTNSGTATFTGLQVEPMWFPSLYSYPTPICDLLQANCIMYFADSVACRLGRIFTGFITHLTASYEGTTRVWDVEVTSADGVLETTTLVNATYNNISDQSIITGIVGGISPFLLGAATPSFATGTPQALAYANTPVCYSGITVNNLQFSDATLREVLNALADLTGFIFGVDAYYNIYYYPPFYNQAAYGFAGNGTQPDNVSTFAYYDYSIEYDASQIQSAINVSGSTYPLTITETWHAQDGSHTEFTTSGQTYAFIPFHNPNQVSMTLTIGGTNYPCTLNTNQAIGNPQALVDVNYPLFQVNPHVSAGTTISLNYTYDALVYVQVRSPDSIGKFGRPLYAKINDSNLVSNAQATTSGEATLQAYAQPRVTLKFKTTKMLSPGQVIELTSTLDGITKSHYVVQKVSASYLGNAINQYDVECGIYLDDFVDFFRNSQKAINRADHDPVEPIKTYNNLLQDSSSYTDSLSIHP